MEVNRKKTAAVLGGAAAVIISASLAYGIVLAQKSSPWALDVAITAVLGIGVLGFLFSGRRRLAEEDELESRIMAESARAAQWIGWLLGYIVGMGIVSIGNHLHRPEFFRYGCIVIAAVGMPSLVESIVRVFVRRKYSGK
jgi:hypothetical protein